MEENHPKKIGIWLDNSEAHLIEFTVGEMSTTKIDSGFTHQVKEESLEKSENLMHNKKRQLKMAYLKQIELAIKNYQEVLLFGPGDAKINLAILLKENKTLPKIKIHSKQTDYLTENQQYAFVRKFFSTNLI
jgi:hypothetical protein